MMMMMGFFNSGYGSKLVKNSDSSAEQSDAAIPVVTDTVEEDVSAAYAQQNDRKNGLKSTLLSRSNRRATALSDAIPGNTTLG